MNERIEHMQRLLAEANEKIQNLILQATAGNVSNIQKSLENIQFVFLELQTLKSGKE